MTALWIRITGETETVMCIEPTVVSMPSGIGSVNYFFHDLEDLD
jgi:hypothetical protein